MGHDLQGSTALTVCDVVWVEDRFDVAANVLIANRLRVVVHVLFVPFWSAQVDAFCLAGVSRASTAFKEDIVSFVEVPLWNRSHRHILSEGQPREAVPCSTVDKQDGALGTLYVIALPVFDTISVLISRECEHFVLVASLKR